MNLEMERRHWRQLQQAKAGFEREFDVELPTFDLFGVGWLPLIRQFLEEARVVGELESRYFAQMKQKLGRLRIYVDGSSEYLRRQKFKLQQISRDTCEFCGAEGSYRDDLAPFVTACNACLETWRAS